MASESPRPRMQHKTDAAELAAHRQMARSFAATGRVRELMVQLEKSGFATPSTKLVDEAALQPISVPHFAPHGS